MALKVEYSAVNIDATVSLHSAGVGGSGLLCFAGVCGTGLMCSAGVGGSVNCILQV